jgi:hypothetical protein
MEISSGRKWYITKCPISHKGPMNMDVILIISKKHLHKTHPEKDMYQSLCPSWAEETDTWDHEKNRMTQTEISVSSQTNVEKLIN